ncbi:uncharacterized protein [Littorina saxatilis]|uniref:Uncharacterized protein n=1 Tax=Littorina saxatilis TaxID=31220 RepID=A0AAN9BLH5_9CAEN
MKFAVALLCLLPLAFCAPVEERGLGDILNSGLGLFGMDLSQLKTIVTGIAGTLEQDATEKQCETQCAPVVNQVMHDTDFSHLLTTFCPFICRSFQSLAHQLNVKIGPTN